MASRAFVGAAAAVCVVAVAGLAATAGPVSLTSSRDSADADYRCTVAWPESQVDIASRAGAADAWPTLQGAFNAALLGSAVVLPPGRFVVSHPLEVPHAVVFAGAGQDATTLMVAPGSDLNYRNEFMIGATAGGGNRVVRNSITRPGVASIAVIAAPGLVGEADEVSHNTVVDAFADGAHTWNCGYGVTVRVRSTRAVPVSVLGLATTTVQGLPEPVVFQS